MVAARIGYLNLICETLWTGAGSCLLISMLEKTQLVSFDWSSNTGAIDVKMDGTVLEEKSSFKMLWLTFSSKLDLGSYIISIHSMKFLYPEVALYLYKSTMWPCME